jgi:hypothetical protein
MKTPSYTTWKYCPLRILFTEKFHKVVTWMKCTKSWEFVASSDRSETCIVLSSKDVSFTCLRSCEWNSVYPCFLSFCYHTSSIVIMSLSGNETQDYRPAPRSKRNRLPDGASVSVRGIIYKLIQHYALYFKGTHTVNLCSALFRWQIRPSSGTKTPRTKTHRY